MKRIMIAIDGSEFSNRAIEKGVALAQKNESEIILLHVIDVAIPDYIDFSTTRVTEDLSDSLKKELEINGVSLLNAAKEKFGDLKSKVTTQLVEKSNSGNVAIAIVDYAEQAHVDMIIMGTHGIGSRMGEKILIGSVTNRVIHNTKIPVLLVK